MIHCDVRSSVIITGTWVTTILFRTDTNSFVANSTRLTILSASFGMQMTNSFSYLVTVLSSCNINLYALARDKGEPLTGGVNSQILSDGAGESVLSYVRIS